MPEKNNRNQRRSAEPQKRKKFAPYWMIENAKSLQRVAKELHEKSAESMESDSLLYRGQFLAGPILLSLAVEIALKAMLCQEQKKEPPLKHDLLDLFQRLEPGTQKSLQAQMPGWTMYPVGFPEGAPYPHESLPELLWAHRDAHTHWRYIHEKPWATYRSSQLDQALTVIINSYYKRWGGVRLTLKT